jgi:hypothetical protein
LRCVVRRLQVCIRRPNVCLPTIRYLQYNGIAHAWEYCAENSTSEYWISFAYRCTKRVSYGRAVLPWSRPQRAERQPALSSLMLHLDWCFNVCVRSKRNRWYWIRHKLGMA